MNYQKQEIKEGINLHLINTDNKFKTNLLSVFITTPLLKEHVTKEALIASVLRRGSNLMPTAEEISIKLEEMYGASFDCGIEKIGDNHVLKFYLETINDEFLPQQEDILKNGLATIFDIVLNPLVENGQFKEEYVKTEKENLRQIIEGKKDNKAKYALDRCIEEMYKDKPYGIYKFGYAEDLENISAKDLYEYYKKIIEQAKMDIFVSGKINPSSAKEIVENDEHIQNLQPRKINYNETNQIEKVEEEISINETMDITQGKLVLGLTVDKNDLDSKYVALLYNTILGGGANSKLFQNVREKASLAYTAGSNYVRQINNIFVRCGIEIANYDKALDIIKQQIKDMEQGNFTEKDLENAKTSIISTIKFIPDEQDTGITYYFGQELSNNNIGFEEYEERVKNITKEQIIELAKGVNIHTIYFLTGKEEK